MRCKISRSLHHLGAHQVRCRHRHAVLLRSDRPPDGQARWVAIPGAMRREASDHHLTSSGGARPHRLRMKSLPTGPSAFPISAGTGDQQVSP
jgi:hypothetical protein